MKIKDPTRGGLANVLNEWCEKSQVGLLIQEAKIPVREGVRSACEMLGIDPFEIGNEGKLVIAAISAKAEEILEALRETEAGCQAEIIGVASSLYHDVVLETSVGGTRIMLPPMGDPIPRIC